MPLPLLLLSNPVTTFRTTHAPSLSGETSDWRLTCTLPPAAVFRFDWSSPPLPEELPPTPPTIIAERHAISWPGCGSSSSGGSFSGGGGSNIGIMDKQTEGTKLIWTTIGACQVAQSADDDDACKPLAVATTAPGHEARCSVVGSPQVALSWTEIWAPT